MKNDLLSTTLAVLMLVSLTTVKAQDIDFERWEIGIDMLPLIGKNIAPPSVSIKKLELKQKENEFGLARRGFRLRFGCHISSPENAFPFNNNNYEILVRPGYEWDRKIKSSRGVLCDGSRH